MYFFDTRGKTLFLKPKITMGFELRQYTWFNHPKSVEIWSSSGSYDLFNNCCFDFLTKHTLKQNLEKTTLERLGNILDCNTH